MAVCLLWRWSWWTGHGGKWRPRSRSNKSDIDILFVGYMELAVVCRQTVSYRPPHHVDLRLIRGISISIISTYVTEIITTLKVTLSFIRSSFFFRLKTFFSFLPLVRWLVVRWLGPPSLFVWHEDWHSLIHLFSITHTTWYIPAAAPPSTIGKCVA